MGKFKVGDRVVMVQGSMIGFYGTIINIKNKILVEFDEYRPNGYGHDGGGLGLEGHCWNCNEQELELIDNSNNYEIY